MKVLVGAVRIAAIISATCVTAILLWLTISVVWSVTVRGYSATLLLGYACLATPPALILFFLVKSLKVPSPKPPPSPPIYPAPPKAPPLAPTTEDDRCYKCGAVSTAGRLCEDCSFEQFREGCDR
jgi:hypothetical protein